MTQNIVENFEKNSQSTDVKIRLYASRFLTSWMTEMKLGLLLTTYQASRLILLGINAKQKLNIFTREYEQCMALMLIKINSL